MLSPHGPNRPKSSVATGLFLHSPPTGDLLPSATRHAPLVPSTVNLRPDYVPPHIPSESQRSGNHRVSARRIAPSLRSDLPFPGGGWGLGGFFGGSRTVQWAPGSYRVTGEKPSILRRGVLLSSGTVGNVEPCAARDQTLGPTREMLGDVAASARSQRSGQRHPPACRSSRARSTLAVRLLAAPRLSFFDSPSLTTLLRLHHPTRQGYNAGGARVFRIGRRLSARAHSGGLAHRPEGGQQ